jgi:iron complex transport system substrate-binding protein
MLRPACQAAVALLALPAMAQDFPLIIDTAFGPVTIDAQPERVATLDYTGADNVPVLGFQSLTVRKWFAPYPN